jgi:transposase-like protein
MRLLSARGGCSVGAVVPPTSCPSCRSANFRHLHAPSEQASVNYYRCGQCGHVWTTQKGDSGKITHVTEKSPAPEHRPRGGKVRKLKH